MKKTALIPALAVLMTATIAQASETISVPKNDWPHQGAFGTYDRAALQRGFQVYKEVCAACHSMKFMSYRNLEALGFSPDEVKAIAANYTVTDGPDDDGEMFERPAMPHDHFVKPFKNDKAARAANNGALPPDLSLIIKSRKGGEDYLYGLLTGYEDAPEGMTLPTGMSYNKYFTGHQIAMAPPIADGQVTYSDGTSATAAQAAHDVTQFLAWAGEPHMEERKHMGVKVVLFLIAFAAIMYNVKRKIWSKLG